MLEQLEIDMENNFFDLSFKIYVYTHSEWAIYINGKHKNIKFLEENTVRHLCDLRLG